MKSASSSLLFTILYADIFQYPYSFDELFVWIPKNIWTRKVIYNTVKILQRRKKISYRKSLYFLYRHDDTVRMRLERERYAADKWQKARRAARILRFIPTLLFIGVTGGLATRNADKDDDIDFYLCTKKGTLWITRLFATFLLEIVGVRRRPESTKVKDTICLNMFVAENALAVPQKERDIYTAHEVLQMVPLWDRNHFYQNFLKKNVWVSYFFPRKWREVYVSKNKPKIFKFYSRNWGLFNSGNKIVTVVIEFFRFFEIYAKYIQIWYMKKRKTNEVISDTIIRFHPSDARIWIKTLLMKKLKQHHLPLDKNFFHP